MLYFAIFVFFITFYRISFLSSSVYLLFFPAILGFICFFSKYKKIEISRKYFPLFLIFSFLSFYCGLLDFFQPKISIDSSFLFRMFTIIFFSFFPAYYLVKVILKGDNYKLERIIKYSFLIQTFIFILMFLIPSLKIPIYSVFGMADSVNLYDGNLESRGFGLSSEINFMSPFLMIYITFLIFKDNIFLKSLIFITQIINSNMALISGILGILVGGGKKYLKLFMLFLFLLIYYFFGISLIKNFMPRVYEEYILGGGSRTADILLSDHVFLLDKLDIFSFLFGFQMNISSSVTQQGRYSDMGWIIMMNYGGFVLIFLFLILIFCLSKLIFSNKLYAIVWFLIGILFNTKGMIIGMNGYFFLSFVLLLSRKYSK